jgi:hypothetical protein
MMQLTQNWIQNQATAQSYARGRGYTGEVSKLIKQGDIYTATVDGTSKYKVKIIQNNNGIEAHCNCPYELEGICKHIVAVSLNILNGQFKEMPLQMTALAADDVYDVPDYEEKLKNIQHFYDKTFLKARTTQQEAFLRAVFAADKTLCKRFLEWIEPPMVRVKVSVSETITPDELNQEIAAQVMALDWEPFETDEPDEEYNYEYDEYEEDIQHYDYQGIAAEVRRRVQPYQQRCITFMAKKQVQEATQVFLSMYEAAILVEEADEVNEYADFSYHSVMIDLCFETLDLWDLKPLKSTDYEIMTKLLWARVKDFACFDKAGAAVPYHPLNQLESFIEAVTPTENAKHAFWMMLVQNDLVTLKNDPLLKSLCKQLDDKALRLDVLEKFALENAQKALEWLELCWENGDEARWVAAAIKMFEKYQMLNAMYLLDFIAKQLERAMDEAFYSRFFNFYVHKCPSLSNYQKWKVLASEKEQVVLVETWRVSNSSLYISVLKHEGRHQDLLNQAQEFVKSGSWNRLNEAAETLFEIFPNEVWGLYTERISKQMAKGDRSRKSYEEYVRQLKPILGIGAKKADTKKFAEELRKTYKNLPAFWDELRKGGF